jgi:hypothetical protein
MNDNDQRRPKHEEEVILLKDLTPRKDVKGGGKLLFGQDRPPDSK